MKRKKERIIILRVPSETFREIEACRDRWQLRYSPASAHPIFISDFCVCLLDRAATQMLADLEGKEC